MEYKLTPVVPCSYCGGTDVARQWRVFATEGEVCCANGKCKNWGKFMSVSQWNIHHTTRQESQQKHLL